MGDFLSLQPLPAFHTRIYYSVYFYKTGHCFYHSGNRGNQLVRKYLLHPILHRAQRS